MLSMSLTALGQGPTTGRIEGTVTDTNGAALPNAEISIVNKATQSRRISLTDDEGHYVALFLTPGVYRVTITAVGFSTHDVADVDVRVSQISVANAKLSASGPRVTVRPIHSSTVVAPNSVE